VGQKNGPVSEKFNSPTCRYIFCLQKFIFFSAFLLALAALLLLEIRKKPISNLQYAKLKQSEMTNCFDAMVISRFGND